MVRACGSYPQCPGFKSLHRHFILVAVPTFYGFGQVIGPFNYSEGAEPPWRSRHILFAGAIKHCALGYGARGLHRTAYLFMVCLGDTLTDGFGILPGGRVEDLA